MRDRGAPTLRGRLSRAIRVARRELRAPFPVTWELVSPSLPGEQFAGQCVLVTGAGGLIGSGLVEGFVAQGALTHAVDVDPAALDRLRDRLQASVGIPASARLVAHVSDIESEEQQRVLAASIDRLDVLVHCAGFNDLIEDVEDATRASWSRVLDVNVVTPALLTGRLTPHLTSGSTGSVVFITSINAVATSRWPHYGAAKAAAAKLVEDLAFQLAPRGVRVNAVAPGWVRDLRGSAEQRAASHQPLGGASLPVEAIVHAVQFLSDARRSPMTTGQQLVVDGGGALQRLDH